MGKLDNIKGADLNIALSAENPTQETIQAGIVSLAKEIETDLLGKMEQANGDTAVLASLGFNAITSDERKFALALNEMIESGEAYNNTGETVPPVTFNRIMENLTKDHDIIGAVDVINGGLSTEFIYSIGVNPAFWGTLCADVKELADKGFRKMNISQFKLSAFLPVCKAFLDLNSPEWLIAYVTTVLSESIAIALEQAIVDGTGKEQPIGMRRSLVNQASGEQTVLTPTEIDDFSPTSLGKVMGMLTKPVIDTTNSLTLDRTVNPSDVAIIMNPTTYWTEFYGTYTVQNANGQFVSGLALPFQIKQSTAVPEGEYIIGLPKDYLFVLGAGAKLGFSDEHRYIQDERVYLGKMYGNGRPKGENLFIRATLKKEAKAKK